MFSTDNQKCQAGFRPLCNKILLQFSCSKYFLVRYFYLVIWYTMMSLRWLLPLSYPNNWLDKQKEKLEGTIFIAHFFSYHKQGDQNIHTLFQKNNNRAQLLHFKQMSKITSINSFTKLLHNIFMVFWVIKMLVCDRTLKVQATKNNHGLILSKNFT